MERLDVGILRVHRGGDPVARRGLVAAALALECPAQREAGVRVARVALDQATEGLLGAAELCGAEEGASGELEDGLRRRLAAQERLELLCSSQGIAGVVEHGRGTIGREV